MRRNAIAALAGAAATLLAQLACAQAASFAGVWKTVSDRSGEAESLVRITQSGDAFRGTVIRVFSPPAETPNPRCERCPGALKDQPIVGIEILRGRGAEGEILDPDEGRIYRCTLTLLDNGTRLEVRGYIGIPFFGRAQVWLRTE